MKTIDEAIKHVEEIAEYNQKVADTHYISDNISIDEIYCDDTEIIEEVLAGYQKCAEEYGQLVEWLRELKTLRKQNRWIPIDPKSLPEHHQRVLVTVRRYDESTVVRVAEYIGKDLKIFNILENSEEWEVGEKGLLGWKPLPTPYEPCDFSSLYPVFERCVK